MPQVERLAVVCLAALGAGSSLRAAQPQPAVVGALSASERALVDKYCVTCHNQKIKTAGLTLDNKDLEHVAEGAEVWEKVIRKVRGGMMPPQGMPRPGQATL